MPSGPRTAAGTVVGVEPPRRVDDRVGTIGSVPVEASGADRVRIHRPVMGATSEDTRRLVSAEAWRGLRECAPPSLQACDLESES